MRGCVSTPRPIAVVLQRAFLPCCAACIPALRSWLTRLRPKTARKLSGEVLVGGVPRAQIAGFSRLASYVLQDDSLYPMLTVYETLLLAARFRLPTRIPLADKQARVESLIDELGIRAARDVVIGDERHKGVSGGERKRTSVGVEIIGDPSLVFLDEPTSGLDAFQALTCRFITVTAQYISATSPPHRRYIAVTVPPPSRHRHTAVTPPLHRRHATVTPQPHHRHTRRST